MYPHGFGASRYFFNFLFYELGDLLEYKFKGKHEVKELCRPLGLGGPVVQFACGIGIRVFLFVFDKAAEFVNYVLGLALQTVQGEGPIVAFVGVVVKFLGGWLMSTTDDIFAAIGQLVGTEDDSDQEEGEGRESSLLELQQGMHTLCEVDGELENSAIVAQAHAQFMQEHHEHYLHKIVRHCDAEPAAKWMQLGKKVLFRITQVGIKVMQVYNGFEKLVSMEGGGSSVMAGAEHTVAVLKFHTSLGDEPKTGEAVLQGGGAAGTVKTSGKESIEVELSVGTFTVNGEEVTVGGRKCGKVARVGIKHPAADVRQFPAKAPSLGEKDGISLLETSAGTRSKANIQETHALMDMAEAARRDHATEAVRQGSLLGKGSLVAGAYDSLVDLVESVSSEYVMTRHGSRSI